MRRFAAWQEREAPQANPSALAGRIATVRRLLAELEREVAGLEAEVALLDRGAQP
jgi:hypothetical protein